jgi:hypothetical protein
MDYKPFKIEVKRGEQIRFVLRNVGTEDHELLLAATKENLKHGELMKKLPHMEHAGLTVCVWRRRRWLRSCGSSRRPGPSNTPTSFPTTGSTA